MHTRQTENHGLGALAKDVAEHASSLVRLELELATLELKRKATSLGVGIGLTVGAAIFALFAFGFVFATIAAGLATFLPTWLALLIVTVFLFALTAVLAGVGVAQIRKGTPPLPEQAIREAKLTTDVLKNQPSTEQADDAGVGVAGESVRSDGR